MLHNAVFIASEFLSEELIEVLIGSFSKEDGNNSKNITIKMSSCFFKHCSNIPTHLRWLYTISSVFAGSDIYIS